MDFFLTFEHSPEERVLSYPHMNRDEVKVIVADYGTREHKMAQERLQRHWADRISVELHEGTRFRWWHVAGGVSPKGTYNEEPPKGWPQYPPAWDHGRIWVRGKVPLIAVSQPYPWLLNEDIEKLNGFADLYGLNFRISSYPSWHNPGHCWFMEWYQNHTDV